MREEAHRVAPSLTVHGPRPRTISKRQEEMFFWPPEHRRKTTESGVFSASRRQPNMSPLERATHNGTTAVRGPDGAGGAVNGGEESRASSPAPQRRTAEEKRKSRGRAWLQRSPRRRAGRTARPLSFYGSPPRIGCPMTRPKIDALSEKNGRTPREKREHGAKMRRGAGRPLINFLSLDRRVLSFRARPRFSAQARHHAAGKRLGQRAAARGALEQLESRRTSPTRRSGEHRSSPIGRGASSLKRSHRRCSSAGSRFGSERALSCSRAARRACSQGGRFGLAGRAMERGHRISRQKRGGFHGALLTPMCWQFPQATWTTAPQVPQCGSTSAPRVFRLRFSRFALTTWPRRHMEAER